MYIDLKTLIKARENFKNYVKDKPDTFAGFLLLLATLKISNKTNFYEVENKKFQKLLDDAFTFPYKNGGYAAEADRENWHVVFPEKYFTKAKEFFNTDEHLTLKDVLTVIFWRASKSDVEHILSESVLLPDIKEKFTDNYQDFLDSFMSNNVISDGKILSSYGLKISEPHSLNFENKLLKKKASELSAASFGQTLYASLDIKKVLIVFNSNPSEGYFSLLGNHSLSASSKVGVSSLSTYLTKSFLLLAGISGTGKSRFVREQAKKWGDAYPNNFELVSVRPDWHEPSDLLGYVTRLGSDDKGAVFVATDVLRFMVNAWLKILECGYELKAATVDNSELLIAKPNGNEIKEVPAYWLCLDEMNLAPVEQYFADYLSVLETCSWESGVYSSSAILKPGTFQELSDVGKQKLAESLGLDVDDEIFGTFLEHGIPLPFNLIVAGTVNMDETTHGFSRKVIDRALTLDFGVFYPSESISNNNYDAFFDSTVTDKKLSYPLATTPDKNFGDTFKNGGSDAGQLSYSFFTKVNAILEGTMFELAYRALKELLLAVKSFKPKTQEELCAVWDDFLMMKVLPRIEGDEEKLAYNSTEANDKGKNILQKLEELLETEFATIWDEEKRPDLLRENAGNIECRSKKKIEQMLRKLDRGFTTFWP